MLKKLSLFMIANLIFISGCTNNTTQDMPAKPASASMGHLISKNNPAIKKVKSYGVQVIMVGDNLSFVLPSDQFFVTNTPLLNSNYYSGLKAIAAVIRQCKTYSIKVSGYTDNAGSPERNLALSIQQALNVEDYLWRQGIDARLISSAGYGEQNPIAYNSTDLGRKENRRIEITVQLITDE